MSTHEGVYACDNEFVSPELADGLDVDRDVTGGVVDPLGYLSAPHTSNLPVSQYGYTHVGRDMGTFADDYYNRVHVTPLLLALGNLLSSQNRNISVWNAYFHTKTLQGITPDNDSGLTMSGVPDLPYTFAPLEEGLYVLNISTSGSPTIDASYSFDFEDELPVVLHVTGRRVVLYPFAPNWDSNVTMRMAFLTKVMQSYNLDEQRLKLRQYPREATVFTVATEKHSSLLHSLVNGWQNKVYGVPRWNAVQLLSADTLAGSSTVYIDVTAGPFYDDTLIALYKDPVSYEVIEIDSSTDTTLTLKKPVDGNWPRGSKLVPLMLCHATNPATVQDETGSIATATIEFNTSQSTEWVAADSTTLYLGLPVLLDKPQQDQLQPVTYERKITVVDNQTANPYWDDTALIPTETRLYSFHLYSNKAIYKYQQFLCARAGKYTAMWVPTWRRDFELLEEVNAASTSLPLKNRGYFQFVDGKGSSQHLYIRMTNGTYFLRHILGSAEIDATREDLSMDSALGVTLNPNNVELICFLQKVRLDADTIDMQFETNTVMRSDVPLRTLKVT